MENECILSIKGIDAYGYSTFLHKGKVRKAHRVAWENVNGPIPNGLHVLHKCDVRNCVNPNHLFLGTNFDNVKDRVSKNRSYRPTGQLNNKSKLTIKQVKFIKNYPKSYGYRIKLAKMFLISIATVDDIRSNRTWIGV